MQNLFRPEVLQARRQDWLGTIEVGATRYGWAFALCAVACVLGMVLFVAFGRYTRHERVEGALVPSGGLLMLSAPAAGTIARCLVAEGDAVVEGQPIAEIHEDVSSLALGDTRSAIDAQLRDQRAGLEADLQGQKTLADEQRRNLRERADTLQHQLELIDAQRTLKQQQADNAEQLLTRIRALHEKGMLGAFEWQERESALLDARIQIKALQVQRLDADRQLAAARAEIDQLPLNTATRTNEIERKLADVSQTMARNEAERAIVVRAPRAGVVSGLVAVNGQTVASGQRLASIIPAGSSLQAELWVPSRAIGFVAPGDRVRLRYDAYPYQNFGSYDGRVVDVAKSALVPEELERLRGRKSAEPMYCVHVALDAQEVSALGRRLALKADMTLDADVLLERRSVYEWIVAPFYGDTRARRAPQRT